MRVYVPSSGPEAWQSLLADPVKHWRIGYSARSLAQCWEAANGVPPEVDHVLGGGTELLLALPEHKVPLPGGGRDSQCDVFALIGGRQGVIATAIEGKVNEPFGPLLGDWLEGASSGKQARLKAILSLLGKTAPAPNELHYQLLHRTAAALVEGTRFRTPHSAMVVHSFSPTLAWFDAWQAFAVWMGIEQPDVDRSHTLRLPSGQRLVLGWAKGDPRFLRE